MSNRPPTNDDKLVAIALRNAVAALLERSDAVPVEEGRALDRALRCCRGIIDIDVVWVRWRYTAAQRGWLTDSELYWDKKRKGYSYPKVQED